MRKSSSDLRIERYTTLIIISLFYERSKGNFKRNSTEKTGSEIRKTLKLKPGVIFMHDFFVKNCYNTIAMKLPRE